VWLLRGSERIKTVGRLTPYSTYVELKPQLFSLLNWWPKAGITPVTGERKEQSSSFIPREKEGGLLCVPIAKQTVHVRHREQHSVLKAAVFVRLNASAWYDKGSTGG